MPPRPVRRFTLIDAMILIAAAALGLAGVRVELTLTLQPTIFYSGPRWQSVSPHVDAGPPDWATFTTNSRGPAAPWFQAAQGWAGSARVVAPGLAALSLAMFVIRLRRPRPPRPRLARQAGLVASLAVTATLGVQLVLGLLRLAISRFVATGPFALVIVGHPPDPSSLVLHQTVRPALAGTAVLASWLVLAFGGRRRRLQGPARRGRDWVEWGGIVVGLGWVTLMLVAWFGMLDEPFG